jgi:hypothetical protein
VGFREMSVIYTNAPEYSVALPIAAAKKTWHNQMAFKNKH